MQLAPVPMLNPLTLPSLETMFGIIFDERC